MVLFTVFGQAQPQGSTRAFVRNGRPIITTTNKNLHQWRDLVAATAQTHAQMFDGPVTLMLLFKLPRPKTLPKKILHHIKKPDLDKLVRAMCDALTGVMWHDDSQIVEIKARKQYGDNPSVTIKIANFEE